MSDYNLYLLEKSSTLYNVSFNYTKMPRFSPWSSGLQKRICGRENITIIINICLRRRNRKLKSKRIFHVCLQLWYHFRIRIACFHIWYNDYNLITSKTLSVYCNYDFNQYQIYIFHKEDLIKQPNIYGNIIGVVCCNII